MNMGKELFKGVKFDGIAWDEELMFDGEKSERFVNSMLNRNSRSEGRPLGIAPLKLNRSSVRTFRTDERITFHDFSIFFNILRMGKEAEGKRFTFPSAGGLYPIDLYLYVKENRVEGLEQGMYFYNPAAHSLRYLNDHPIPQSAHYYGNRKIFQTSAFSLFFFYNPLCSFPKYGGDGLFYGILDTGIILQQLSSHAAELKLGTCIIGDLNFDRIKNHFNENSQSVYICCMEAGIPGLAEE